MTEYNRDFTKPENLNTQDTHFVTFGSPEKIHLHISLKYLCSRCDHLSSKLPHETNITTDRR